jgi:hypothetical protein
VGCPLFCVVLLLTTVRSLHAQRATPPARGVLRPDLVGKLWSELPATKWPHYALPMRWKTEKKYLLRYFQPEYHKYIITVLELPADGDMDGGRIVSAVDLTARPRDEPLEHDCFYRDVPPCDGRLCDGLLLGVGGRFKNTVGIRYRPAAVWKITATTLRFEKISSSRVVCEIQDSGS